MVYHNIQKGEVMKDTNYKLRGWLGANRVSVKEFSKMTGIPYDTLKTKMSGKSMWKLSDIEKLIEATGLTFEELF